jgi:predicted nuclease of predicted toxin-antitoxin system
MRFLANENIPKPSIAHVRQAGIDIISISEESPGISDEEVLAQAARDHLIIWTFDRDYGSLIYQQGLPTPAGIMYFRFDPATAIEAGEIFLNLLDSEGIAFEGMFTVVDRSGIRQRALP